MVRSTSQDIPTLRMLAFKQSPTRQVIKFLIATLSSTVLSWKHHLVILQ